MSFSEFDHQCMAAALRFARRGLNSTQPNPAVGCLIAKDGRVVGSGWHQVAGEAHAEIHALTKAGGAARGAAAYVTLEPCSHHGRTDPCTGALIAAGVHEVIMAGEDPNPEVSGRGRQELEAAGIACRTGLMQEAAESLNAGFMSRMRRGRPWLRVKLAQSLDGRTSLENGDSQWISGEAAREDVQHWRARCSAVMTGIGTVLADDPSLNVRLAGVERQPDRIIVDSNWRTPPTARTLALNGRVIIAGVAACSPAAELSDSGAKLLDIPSKDGRVDLAALLERLGGMEINDIQVEAGATLCGALLRAGLVDELLIYQAHSLLGDGARPGFSLGPLDDMDQRMQFKLLDSRMLGNDLRLRLRPQYPGG